jgi:hypothetical protein
MVAALSWGAKAKHVSSEPKQKDGGLRIWKRTQLLLTGKPICAATQESAQRGAFAEVLGSTHCEINRSWNMSFESVWGFDPDEALEVRMQTACGASRR